MPETSPGILVMMPMTSRFVAWLVSEPASYRSQQRE
jgi:hypothetical protein